jgi:hypothetical protein
MAKLNELFGKVKKNEQKKQQKEILRKSRNPDVLAEVKVNVWTSIKKQLIKDETMKQQRRALHA